MKEKLSVQIQVQADDLYRYMLYHTYSSLSGMFSVLLGIASLVYGAFLFEQNYGNLSLFFLVLGAWFTILSPMMLRTKASGQIRRVSSFQKPIAYTFSADGIELDQDEMHVDIKWNEIRKTVFLRKDWILYTDRIHAFVLPVNQLEEYQDELKVLFRENIPKKRIKGRK